MFSLQSLCLDSIAQNFEQFFSAFTTLKTRNLQRNCEFVQRRFSVQLANALHKKEALKEKYLEFLINEYLTFVDGQWFKNCQDMNCYEDIFSRLPNLKAIRFDNFCDEILVKLVIFCPKIIEMDMRNSNLTDDGIESLCKKQNEVVPFPELKNLFLQPSRITDRGAKLLIQYFPLLERIDYPNVPLLLHSIYRNKLTEFNEVNCYKLVQLSVSREFIELPDYTDVLKTCLTVCPKLESLECCITEKEQLNFFKNTHLKELTLYICIFDEKINMDSFLNENGMIFTFLLLYNCTISVSSLAKHCPVLKRFLASNIDFTNEDVTEPKLRALTKYVSDIDLSNHKPTSLRFSSSPNLELIFLSSCNLPLEMKYPFLMWCNSSSADTIGFAGVHLGMKFLQDILLSCPTLKLMHLNDCSFDVHDPKETLHCFTKDLCNKPKIVFEP